MLTRNAPLTSKQIHVYCKLRPIVVLMKSWFKFLEDGNNVETYKSYEGHLESKERFAIKKYLLIIGKKKNMQVLSHTFTYFST